MLLCCGRMTHGRCIHEYFSILKIFPNRLAGDSSDEIKTETFYSKISWELLWVLSWLDSTPQTPRSVILAVLKLKKIYFRGNFIEIFESYRRITFSAVPAITTFLRSLLKGWNQTCEVIVFLAFITSGVRMEIIVNESWKIILKRFCKFKSVVGDLTRNRNLPGPKVNKSEHSSAGSQTIGTFQCRKSTHRILPVPEVNKSKFSSADN